MGVLIFTPSVSAATGGETVVTAQVMPVRHIVVDKDGAILRIISNTSENVTPIVHLDSADGTEVPLTDDVAQRYEGVIADLDMSHPADYVRKSPLKRLFARLQQLSVLQLRTVSQIRLLL